MTVIVNNIYCVGRNYLQHARELNNAVPESPLLFLKPTHALTEAHGQDIILPADRGGIHYEVEFVVHLKRHYEPGISLDDLIDKMAIGIDFTLRDVQTELKEKGYPWVLAKGFPNSAVVSPWQPFPGLKVALEKEFSLEKNGQEVQRGKLTDMIFDLPALFEFTARNLGLGEGDIFFTGTPEGVGPVFDGDLLVLKWDGSSVGSCQIKI